MSVAISKITYSNKSTNTSQVFDVEVTGRNIENYYVVAFIRSKVIKSTLKIISNITNITWNSDIGRTALDSNVLIYAYVYDVKKGLLTSGKFQEFVVAVDSDGKKYFKHKGILEATFPRKFNQVEADEYVSVYGKLDKIKVDFTIGVFFDGTGNNMKNSENVYYKNLDSSHKLAKEIPEKGKYVNIEKKDLVIDYDSSYWNPYSNVALLFDLYETSPLSQDDVGGKSKITLKQYVEGIGTLSDNTDDFFGSALGEGTNGLIGKTANACNKLAVQISGVLKSKKNSEIGSITFDVFGFSRGAAAARHFCNEMRGTNSIERTQGGDIRFNLGLLGDFLKKNDVQHELIQYSFEKLSTEKVTIRFLGLFDTVVSQMVIKNHFGKLFDLISPVKSIPVGLGSLIETGLDHVRQRLDNLSIENIVHLVAKDEYRVNFASTRIGVSKINEANKKNKLKTRALEFIFDGVHSDIGGGYGAAKLDVTIVDLQYVSNAVGFEETIPERLYKLRSWIISKGYCTDDQLKVVKIKSNTLVIPAGLAIQEHLYHLKATRSITPRFSIVPMNVMQNLAVTCSVPLNGSIKNRKYPFEYDVPKDLKKYKEEVLELTKDLFYGKKEKEPKEKLKKSNFIHLSSNYNISSIIKEKGERITIRKELDRIFYVNSPNYATDQEISYQREIYNHNQ